MKDREFLPREQALAAPEDAQPTPPEAGAARDLARALRLWRKSARRIGCIVVAGPGGAGTARALRAVISSPEARDLDWAVGRARPRPGAPLEPLAEAAVALLRRARERARRGEAAWEAHWDRTLVELGPALKALLPRFDWGRAIAPVQSLRPRLARSRLLDALARLILRHAALRPVVLVVEGLDRADAGTREALERLAEAPFRFLRRPECRARLLLCPTWAWDAPETAALRQHLGPSREIRLDRIAREDWEAAWQRRLDAMPARRARVLLALAVLERPATAVRVASVLSASEADARAELEALEAEGWLTGRPEAGLEIEDRLAAEVVKGFAGPEAWRTLEGACAWTVLASERDRPPAFAILAHLEGSASWGVYQGYARAAFADVEALGFPEAGIPLARRITEAARRAGQPVQIRDVERLARLLEEAGRSEEAFRTYEAWLADESGEPQARARAFRRLGELYGRRGDRRAQLECFDRGLEALGDETESVERLAIFADLARLALDDADLGASLRWCEVGLDLAELEALDRDEEFREILRITREIHSRRGEYVEAEGFERRRLAASRAAGDAIGVLESLENLSELALSRGDVRAGETWAVRALEAAGRSGARYLVARAQVRLARIRARCGAEDEALEALDRAGATLLELGEDGDRANVADSIAVLALVRGRYGRAAQALRESARCREPAGGGAGDGPPLPLRGSRSAEDREAAVRFHEAALRRAVVRGDGVREAESRLALGDLYLEAGELEEACGTYLAGSRIPEVTGDPGRRGAFLVRLARVGRLRGHGAPATAYLTQALDCAAEGEHRGLIGASYVEAGLLFLREGELSKSLRYIARALEIFRDDGGGAGGVEASLAVAGFLTEIGACQAGAVAAIAAVERVGGGSGDLALRAHLAAARAFRLGGRLDEARAHREMARGIAASLQSRFEAARLEIERAAAALDEGAFEGSMEGASKALAEARAIGARDLETDALHLLGCACGDPRNRCRDFVRARQCLRKALDLGEGRRIFLAEAAASMARLFLDRGREGGAARWLCSAAEHVERVLATAPATARDSFLARRDLTPVGERFRTQAVGVR